MLSLRRVRLRRAMKRSALPRLLRYAALEIARSSFDLLRMNGLGIRSW